MEERRLRPEKARVSSVAPLDDGSAVVSGCQRRQPRYGKEERSQEMMTQRRVPLPLAAVAALALGLVVSAGAQLPNDLQAKDVGSPGMAGSAAVDNQGVFTIKGGG